jgi:NTE family protein
MAEGRPLPERFARTVGSLARAILGTSVGWVLGAGGARGWSHIGILEVLTRARLPIDAVAGSSMGSIVGGLVAQGTPIGELRRVVGEWPRRLRGLREWRAWRMHMGSEHGVESLLMHFFQDRTVPALDLPYAANAVDIESGEEVVIRQGLLRQATRASMAFPGWLPPLQADGRLLVDGATLNPVPVGACRALGADMIIAVNVLGPLVPRPVSRRWPARQFDIMMRTFQLSGYSMGRAHGIQGDAVLTPDLGDAQMHSFERYDEMIAGGVREGEARVDAVLATYARWCQARQ